MIRFSGCYRPFCCKKRQISVILRTYEISYQWALCRTMLPLFCSTTRPSLCLYTVQQGMYSLHDCICDTSRTTRLTADVSMNPSWSEFALETGMTHNSGMVLRSQLANFSQFWPKFCHPYDQCNSNEKMFTYMWGGVWVVAYFLDPLLALAPAPIRHI